MSTPDGSRFTTGVDVLACYRIVLTGLGTPDAAHRLTELPICPVASPEAARLEELRLVAIEELVRRELRLRHTPALHAATLQGLDHLDHQPYVIRKPRLAAGYEDGHVVVKGEFVELLIGHARLCPGDRGRVPAGPLLDHPLRAVPILRPLIDAVQ